MRREHAIHDAQGLICRLFVPPVIQASFTTITWFTVEWEIPDRPPPSVHHEIKSQPSEPTLTSGALTVPPGSSDRQLTVLTSVVGRRKCDGVTGDGSYSRLDHKARA